MRRYKEVSSLSPVDAAYIAGLVDGEGTITLSRKHAGDGRQLVVSISNTEAALLEYVLHTVAAGKITRKRTMKPHHSPGLTYAIWNRQALRLLFQIESFLRSYKRLRARLVLDNYVRLTPRNGKYTPAIRAERAQLEATLLATKTFGRETPAGSTALRP
ncbi:MAG TPA: LAGLIDADG family homing endonuclease [Gammaproteobacteria bacterium]